MTAANLRSLVHKRDSTNRQSSFEDSQSNTILVTALYIVLYGTSTGSLNYGTRRYHRREAHLSRHDLPVTSRRLGLFLGRKLTLWFLLTGNLPYEVKPFEVEEILAKEGFSSLDKIHISIDPVSARNPGYCFVDFKDRETAERALSSLSAVVYGRTLKVGPCEPKKPRRGFRDEGSTSRRWGDWNVRPSEGGVPIGKVNGTGEEKGPYWAIDHFEDVVRNPGGRRLYVGGLGKMVDQAQHQEELSQIFSGFKPDVTEPG